MVRPAPVGMGAVAPPTGLHVRPSSVGMGAVAPPTGIDTNDPADSNDRSESPGDDGGSYRECDLLCLSGDIDREYRALPANLATGWLG